MKVSLALVLVTAMLTGCSSSESDSNDSSSGESNTTQSDSNTDTSTGTSEPEPEPEPALAMTHQTLTIQPILAIQIPAPTIKVTTVRLHQQTTMTQVMSQQPPVQRPTSASPFKRLMQLWSATQTQHPVS